MPSPLRLLFWLFLLLPACLLAKQESGREVVVLTIDGPIGPATSDYVVRGIKHAEKRKAHLIVLRMDTPGGLDLAMRDIIQAIIGSSVPVASYVSPSGARAASAGTYILYASHIAAMAPATTLGAATPVQIGGTSPGKPDQLESPFRKEEKREKGKEESKKGKIEKEKKEKNKGQKDKGSGGGKSAMERKIVNDAAAYIRGLAQMRGRNAEWAERAVREAVSLPAKQAKDKNVIDLIANNMDDLLRQLKGRKVSALGHEQELKTDAVRIVNIEPDWRSKILSTITDPNILPILMTLGMLGLLYEFINPGSVLPGVLGGIFLILGLYAAQVLPVNYAGVALILLGVAFMVGEAFMPSFGALGIGGVIAFIIGSIILIDTDVEGFQVSIPFISTVAVVNAGVFIGIMTLVLKTRNRPMVSGEEELIGSVGEVMADFSDRGQVFVHSEQWQAVSDQPLFEGARVRVVSRDGLVLTVEPVSKTEES